MWQGFLGFRQILSPQKFQHICELKPRAQGLVYPATVTFHYLPHSFKNNLSLSLRLGEVDWLTEVGDVANTGEAYK